VLRLGEHEQIVAKGSSRTEARNLNVSPGQSSQSLLLDGLSIGQVEFTAYAFGVACTQVSSSTVADAGAYTVAVGNKAGVSVTDPVPFICDNIPIFPSSDFLANRTPLPPPGISPYHGVIQTSNTDATIESGEPNHAGKPGGKSVWYAWKPDRSGIATFQTTGSTFDTLLAVYTGSSLSNLAPIASNEPLR